VLNSSGDRTNPVQLVEDLASVFLDRELRIKRFTASAKTLFDFVSTDLGRPLSELSDRINYPALVADAQRSLSHLQPAQREISASDRWFLATVLPDVNDVEVVNGVVLTFLDITDRMRRRKISPGLPPTPSACDECTKRS